MVSPSQNKCTPSAEQRNIIKDIDSAILVLAPAGSGKTRTLVAPISQAIKSGVPARKILCLTFTNRAAQEMRERVQQYYPEALSHLTIKTFHGLCTQILRVEARKIGLPSDFIIYDEMDSVEVIKSIFNLPSGKDRDQEAFSILKQLKKCKIEALQKHLSLNSSFEEVYASLGRATAKQAKQYQDILRQRHALDFDDLVFYVHAMFHSPPEIQQSWSERFDLIQVDEVQDTHMSEYQIVRYLTSQTGKLTLIGDLDQTIYEWRGSQPDQVINQFKKDFNPKILPLTFNYRATQILLNAASAFASSLKKRYTQCIPAKTCESGEAIQIYYATSEVEETMWIAKQIKRLAAKEREFSYNRTAILTRSNRCGVQVYNTLGKQGIPCITVEQYKFFDRQEVKDALAYLKMLVNPFDVNSVRRILLRPTRSIGATTIEKVIEEGELCGLKLTDLAASQTFTNGDPFTGLLNAYSSGAIVIFDVETTGLSIEGDEVIEIAATRLVAGRVDNSFHSYIVNKSSVGESEKIHGISDLFLAQHGRAAREAFHDFFNFVGGALLVGHNVSFDIKMTIAHAQRVGVPIPNFTWFDTWDMATRFIQVDNYRLETLAKELELPSTPTHRASDDVQTTLELLQTLIPLIKAKSKERQALVQKYGNNFRRLAEQLATWHQGSQEMRPVALLETVLNESGLYDYYYSKSNERLKNLAQLIKVFETHDNPDLHPDTNLRSILEFATLAKNVDYLSKTDNQVLIITVHQAKGLEFDNVFLAGLCDDEFPTYHSLKNGNLEEEKRTFYVAMTRAQKRLFISAPSQGYNKTPSRFIKLIPEQYIKKSLSSF